MKIILRDGTEIGIINFASNTFVVHSDDRQGFISVWEQMTSDNLARVRVEDDGNTIMDMESLILDGTQTTMNIDGTFTCYFYFHGQEYVHEQGMSEEDMEYAQAGRILLGEEE